MSKNNHCPITEIWEHLDQLSLKAYGKGHLEQFSGSPSYFDVYESCLKQLLTSGKFMDNFRLAIDTGNLILKNSESKTRD